MKVGILTSHPIQYQAPWFRALAQECDLTVYFAYRPNAAEQGQGFGQAFTWDVDLLSGYKSEFLSNVAKQSNTGSYAGCDTPIIADRIAQEKFDAFIVTGWYLKCFWQAIKACRKLKIPVLVRGDSQLATPRSKLKAFLKEFVYRRMLKCFDGFLTVGQRNREYLQHYGVPAEKIFPAPHFIDNASFAQRAAEALPQREAMRKAWGTRPGQIVVLFVGKFIKEKGLEVLLTAMAKLEIQHPGKFKLVLVGSGPLESDLRQIAALVRVDATFAGFKNQGELPACYAAADVLALTSVSETWGLVVNEAMACGIPAIVSSVCGCAPDLIENGVTGFTFPVGDANEFANALCSFANRFQTGHTWDSALQEKLVQYDVMTCSRGTLRAIHSCQRSA